ncbi:hypothetical protein E1297_28950 [Roseibium sp. RKSG952]|nr:hypothetical protein [Roseibium sp. RKSG952]
MALIKFVFRLFGLILVAISVVALVADGSRSIARSELVFMPLGQAWFNFSPETLNLAQAAVQRHVSPFLWDPVIQTLLTLPVWAVAGPVGLLFLVTSARQRRRGPVLT